MRYFVTSSEDERLDAETRKGLRGSFVQLPSGATHYELTGPSDGEVVILVGGLTIPLFYWDDVVVSLHAQGLRTLTYSLYGRGYSERVAGDYDEALFVRQLAELLDALDIPAGSHLVGTSMGALIAMAFLARQPTSISTLTLIGPAGLGPQEPLQRLLFRSDLLTTVVAKRLGNRMLQQHLGHNVRDPRKAVELDAMVRPCYRYEGSIYALFSTLKNFKVYHRAGLYEKTGDSGIPKMLIWGADDQVTPITSLDEVRKLLRPTDYQIFEDCGHMAPFERPADVAEKLAVFLNSAKDREQS